ncbi:MAG TPA: hypothetical protein VJ572_08335 [Azonexus sp.]|nr:hypothetical protein [Azonexus sp.]
MRYLIALVFCLMMVSAQVHACRDPNSWDMVFFETIPNPQPDADMIAKVSLSDVNEEMNTATVTAIATVIQVLKTSDARVHEGDKIAMKYRFTSCGPDHKNGDQGTIIAKTGSDINGRPMLYPYMHNFRGRITLPSLSE